MSRATRALHRRPSGIYYVRLFVPARLQAAVGKGEVHRTTGCRDLRLAKLAAAEIAVEWHTALHRIERMDITKVTAGSVMLLGDGFIRLIDAARELGADPISLASELSIRGAAFSVEADSWAGWSVDDLSEFDFERDELGQSALVWDEKKLGKLGERKTYTGRLALHHASEALSVIKSAGATEVIQFKVSRHAYFLCVFPGHGLHASELQVRKTDVEALRSALSLQFAANKPPELKPALTSTRFSDFAADYLIQTKGLSKGDQARRRRDQCDAFAQLMGDPFMHSIDRTTMRNFVSQVKRIPDERHNVRRRFAVPEATFPELIELAEKHALATLTVKSQHRMVDGVTEILEWAKTEMIIDANPGKGLGSELRQKSGERATKAHEQREALSDVDLGRIMSAAWFKHGVGERTAKGKFYAYRPHYYWLPLMGLYVGGRLNELSQLYLSDVRTIHDIPYISFNLAGADKLDLDEEDAENKVAAEVADKSLKTVSSSRDIPIHDALLGLGFLEYVESLRKAGYERLFPELKFDDKKGYGRAAGKWFNERYLGNTLEIERNGLKTFHSMRHNFATALGRARVPSQAKSDLMGHSRGASLADQRYDKGAGMADMRAYVNKIDYALPAIAVFKIDEGVEAVRDALGFKDQHDKARSRD